MSRIVDSIINNRWQQLVVIVATIVGTAIAVMTLMGFPGSPAPSGADEVPLDERSIWQSTGSDRPMYDYTPGMAGLDRPTFNSFRGVPNVGDEANFVVGKVDGAPGNFFDPVPAEIGDILLIRMYVHNNADSVHNGDRMDGRGVSTDTRVAALIPETSGRELNLLGRIQSDNASPQQVVDSLVIQAGGDLIRASYVPGSARLLTNAFTDQETEVMLTDDLVADHGQLVGWDRLDGVVPGCFEFIAVVTFQVEILAA